MDDAIAWSVVVVNAGWLLALAVDPAETRASNMAGWAIGITAAMNASFALWKLI